MNLPLKTGHLASTAAPGSPPVPLAERGESDFTHQPVLGRLFGDPDPVSKGADLAVGGSPPKSRPPRGSLPLGAEIHQAAQLEPFRVPERIGLKGARRRATDAEVLAAITAGERTEAPPFRRSCRVVEEVKLVTYHKPPPVRKGAGKGPRNLHGQPGMMRF